MSANSVALASYDLNEPFAPLFFFSISSFLFRCPGPATLHLPVSTLLLTEALFFPLQTHFTLLEGTMTLFLLWLNSTLFKPKLFLITLKTAPPQYLILHYLDFCMKNLATSPLSCSPCMLSKISFPVCHSLSYASHFLLSTTISFSNSPNTTLPSPFILSLLLCLSLSSFLSHSFSDPAPNDSFTGCGMRCVISEWHVSHRATHPEESGCVERVWWGRDVWGAETGSRGLEEVKRRGRDRWGRADKHERSNKRGEGLRKENKQWMSRVQERRLEMWGWKGEMDERKWDYRGEAVTSGKAAEDQDGQTDRRTVGAVWTE